MDISLLFLTISLLLTPSSSSPPTSLKSGSSLSVENPIDVLTSPNGVFSAGFHPVGDNAFHFAVWFTNSTAPTLIWIASRDQPINGKGSKLKLSKNGNLILIDAGLNTLWTTSTFSSSLVQLHIHNTGNLVLEVDNNTIIWQSFNFPTNTLLPYQSLTRYTTLISSRTQTNHSSGFYKLLFDTDSVLNLLYDGPKVSSSYWPDPWLMVWDAGRTTYNSSRVAVFDSLGYFRSSDSLQFWPADVGLGPQRRLTLDSDGNLRLYSLNEITMDWTVSWQAMADPCRAHGLCGPNSICSYDPYAGRGCSCVPGYKVTNPGDWTFGCELDQDFSRDAEMVSFASVKFVEFYGYEYDVFKNFTLEICKAKCLESSICKGFLIKFEDGIYNCYAKLLLLNGKSSPNLLGTLYVKINASKNVGIFPNEALKEIKLICSGNDSILLDRKYEINRGNKFLKFLIWFTTGFGLFEILFIIIMCWLMFMPSKNSGVAMQGYHLAAIGFRKFSYAELKKATRGFSEEIGRGGGGVVYKGVLFDNRIAAVKRLNQATQGKSEFLAEISTIGRLNHMNLIDMWGYCAEGKHRLLVYEYMENGSLAHNLNSRKLDWEKRFEIALGTAKGLAYLHEECLEWVLHCDVKPHNILVDTNYQPKIADFGLSKLLNRGGGYNSQFSRMRGTRGYMAPEWVSNLPITSKVDVYSYGIVVLEMVTGRNPNGAADGEGEIENPGLVNWVREKMQGGDKKEKWIEEIIDPKMDGQYELDKAEILVTVALQCVEEEGVARPTMSQVVDMLQCHGNGSEILGQLGSRPII